MGTLRTASLPSAGRVDRHKRPGVDNFAGGNTLTFTTESVAKRACTFPGRESSAFQSNI